MKLKRLNNFFWLIYTSIFLTGIAPVLALSDDELNQQRSLIQRSFNPQPNNFLLQSKDNDIKGKAEPGGNEFIPESPEPLKDYLLNTGDVVQINILSQDIESENTLSVNPEGKIFVPKIGEFSVLNLSSEQLKNKIKERISKKLKDFEISVMLKKVRSVKVFLTGYAIKPGTYTIEYGTRILELLRRSEGITENGSIRNIEITSVTNKKKYIDLYNFVYKGILEQNPRLNAGDKIYIPYISRRIAIVGSAVRPGIYELKENDNPVDLIKLAGGFANGAAANKIVLWKNGMNNISTENVDLNINNINSADEKLEDGDILFIPALKQPQEEAQVHIYGQIGRPGSFPFKEGTKFSDYLKLAGGVSTLADLENVKVTRVKNVNGVANTKTFTVDANDILYNGNTQKDFFMEANDVIFIPEKFFNFRNFTDITGLVLTTLGIVSLVLSFTK
jgi:protein involved in polysaccharide export with SLBB domain